MRMQQILSELGLDDFLPRFQAKNVDESIFKTISISNGHLRMSQHTQNILMMDIGLRTK